MVRSPCCSKMGLKKGPWTPEEDHILIYHIQRHGHGNWRALPKLAGLLRCGKSCRLRWTNYLRPDIKRGNFTKEEEDKVIRLHQLLGNKWSAIAAKLPGRTDNEIKNMWHTHFKKKLTNLPEKAKPKKQKANKLIENNNESQLQKTNIHNTEFLKTCSNTNESSSLEAVSPSRPSHGSDCLSASSSATNTDLDRENNNINIDQEAAALLMEQDWIDEFCGNGQEMDKSFWSEVTTVSDLTNNTACDHHRRHEDQTTDANFLLSNLPGEEYGNDVMDFWLSLFHQAGESHQLSRI